MHMDIYIYQYEIDFFFFFPQKDHPWIQNMDAVSTIPLGEQVRAKIKQFSLMNKFKKMVLRVSEKMN